MRLTKKTSGKGHKWKKGHSCTSNPSNTRHRDAARGAFFQKVEGKSGLTQAAVAEHEAAFRTQGGSGVKSIMGGSIMARGGSERRVERLGRGSEVLERQMEELNVDEDDLKSAGRSFNTFATNITTCTIPAFEKFFCSFSVGSELHTRMLAIHAAAQEYLRESNTPENSTSYFCSLLVSLEGMADSEADTAATLALMARVMRRVAPAVLRARFGEVATRLNDALTRYHDTNNTTLITNALGSLSVVLREQDRAQWTYPSTLNLLDKLLAFTTHPKPKIRKAAHYNVSAVLTASCFILEEQEKLDEAKEQQEGGEGEDKRERKTDHSEGGQKKLGERVSVVHPAAGHVADYLVSQVRAASETDNTKTRLHLLVLLRQVIPAFPKKKVKSVCEMLLSLMQLGRSLTNTCAMQALYSLLVSHPAPDILPLDTNVALVTALIGRVAPGRPGRATAVIVPGKNDSQPASAWITVVTVAIINICKLNHEEGLLQVTLWVQQLIPYWQSDHHEVQDKVYQSIDAVLRECAGDCGQEYLSGPGQGQVEAVLNGLVGALSLQYQPAWAQVFQALGVALEVLGPSCPALAQPCLTALCQLMANPELPHRGALERAVGAGVGALGPRALMEVVPFSVTGDIGVDEPSFWTLPLLIRFVGSGTGICPSLCYFVEYFVPRAAICHQLATQDPSSPLLARTYKQVEVQVWAALPKWCRRAQDADQALTQESFARLLCEHIRNRPDTRQCVMGALRILLTSPSPPALLATYAKNYLPALFNVYLSGVEVGTGAEKEDRPSTGQRQAALATVRAYIGVTEVPTVSMLLNQIMIRHNDPTTDPARHQALLDLTRTFLPRLNQDQLAQVYTTIISVLGEAEGQSKDQAKGKGPTKKRGSHKEQKAAYRLLEELLATDTPAAQDFMTAKLENLTWTVAAGLAGAAPPARPPRLRCLTHILKQLPPSLDQTRRSTLLAQVVGECVMCCAPASSRATRKAAFTLLAQVGATIQRLDQCSAADTVRAGLKLLLAGLVGSSSLAANSLLAITALTYQYKDVMPQDTLDQLMKETCTLLKCSSREIIGSCLSFLKSCVVIFPPQVMSGHVETVVRAICGMKEDCQRKFRLKTRDIFDRLARKYGADYITTLVPTGSIIHTCLKNLRKAAARKQRARDSERDTQDDNDEEFTSRALPASLEEILAEIDTDDDEDDGEGEGGKKGRGKKMEKGGKKMEKGGKKMDKGGKKNAQNTTWIKEDDEEIVDLLDASAGQAIMSGGSKPGRGRAGRTTGGFKVDENTGKLIITDGEAAKDDKIDFSEDLDEFLGLKAGAARGRVSQKGVKTLKRQRTFSGGSAEVTQEPSAGGSREAAGGSSRTGDTPLKKKKRRYDYGSEFRSGRAGGDMTGRGQVAPYAYVQFSKERLNKRKKAKFDGQFSSLVRGAKRGVAGAKRGKAGKKAGKRR